MKWSKKSSCAGLLLGQEGLLHIWTTEETSLAGTAVVLTGSTEATPARRQVGRAEEHKKLELSSVHIGATQGPPGSV